MQDGVFTLMAAAGLPVKVAGRGYRPSIPLLGFDAKILKPQNIVEMLHFGSRDIGFAGADWVAELSAELVELVDTGLDPVRIVAAAPMEMLVDGQLPKRKLVIASEYERLTTNWIAEQGLDATFVRSYGATEVFPPQDADCIVDNTSTGSTLVANGLEIFADVARSSTRLYANPKSLEDPAKKEQIDRFVMLLRSVLDARRRAILELNVASRFLEAVVSVLPAMREPTITTLHHNAGYALKAAVPRADLPLLIPRLKEAGGTDILVTPIAQIVA